MIVILLGTADFGLAFMRQQALTNAAREGARAAVAARPITDADVQNTVQAYLNDARIADASISVAPSVAAAASGTPLTVTATKSHSMIVIPMTLSLKGTATMVKE